MDVAAWDPATWQAVAAWATVLVYVVIGAVAWSQVKEARQLRDEQVRPWVVVDFEPGFIIYIAIENIGKTVAKDVHIAFDPPLSSTFERPWEWELSTLFTDGIPLLPPGKRIRFFFDGWQERFGSDLPKSYGVDVTYQGPIERPKPYRTTDTLALPIYQGSELPAKGLPEIVQELKAVNTELAKLNTGIKGLQVTAVDKEKQPGR